MLKSKPVLIVLIILGLITIGLNVVRFEDSEGPAPIKAIDMDKTLTVKQGDSFTFDLKVNSIKTEGTNVVANLSVNNNGSGELMVSYIYFYLLNDNDEDLGSSILSQTSTTNLANSINAGENANGDIYFAIPTEDYTKMKIVVPDYETGQGEIEYIIKLNK